MNSSRKDRRAAGWISTLMALVVLVVVGFLCGALAGFLWEEPGLVLAYLSGKTEPVEWSDTSEPASPAEPAPVAAAPPSYAQSADLAADTAPKLDAIDAPPAPEPPEVKAAVERAPAPAPVKPVEKKAVEKKPASAPSPAAKPAPTKPAKVAAATPAGRFSVQVGAFADRASADKLASRLRANGYDTFVKADSEGGGKRFRVRVGPVSARARAEELAAKLAKGEKLPTWILDESKG
jgi:DedD protein